MNQKSETTSTAERVNLPIEVAAAWLARPILEILHQYHHPDCPEPVRAHFRTVMKWMARDLENFVKPAVSVAAQERASQMGVSDMRRFRWNDQPKLLKDPGGQSFIGSTTPLSATSSLT